MSNQLSLFESFCISEENWSQSLELFDSIPKFVYHRQIRSREATNVEREITHRGERYKVEIIPALIKGEDDTNRMWAIHPNKREELIMHALRYMAVQQLADYIDCKPESEIETSSKISTKTDRVRITFTIHQLRKELKRMGHGYNWVEIEEGLEVLSNAILKIKRGHFWAKGHILESCLGSDDEDGRRSVVFHPLASKAILSGASRRIRYDKLMSLKLPLSRWIYLRMCHFVTNAERPSFMKDGIGLKFTYDEVFEQSGLVQLTERKYDLRNIRNALEELKASGVLCDDETGKSWIEDRRKGEWICYPSTETVTAIIESNRHSPTQPQKKLSIA